MIRISLSFFYNLGAVLRPIATIQSGVTLGSVWGALYQAQTELNSLLITDWFIPAVKTATASGNKLHDALKKVTDRNDFDSVLSYVEIYDITSSIQEFETVLRASLFITDTYFVTGKAAYDTTTLIMNPEKMFPSDLGLKTPTAIPDIREAGKCLAFELSTASGFHVLRATETVVREYWTSVSNGAKHPRLKTIGTYAAKMEELGIGKDKVIATLKQISNLHRNPLIHPDESLTLEDAITLLGICQSAISAMLKEIPIPQSVIIPSPHSA
jgi:hypothetical protein